MCIYDWWYVLYLAMQSGGYGNKTPGQLVMDRYTTLAIAKEEAAEKHHIQLQEVGLNEGDALWLYNINSCIVLHSF